MTIAVVPARRRRSDAGPGHAYCVPVVRELPSPPVNRVRDGAW